MRSNSARLVIAAGTDLLRVMISKSLNFTFNVTVRPRDPLSSQCRQDLVYQRLPFGGQGLELRQVVRERVLGSDRLADPVNFFASFLKIAVFRG
jgi:hypothetical protein